MYAISMPIVRKVMLGVAGATLVFFLFMTAVDVGIVRVVGSPAPIKRILADSGIYNSIVPSSLDQAKQISGSQNQIPLNDPIVRSAAETTFSGQFLQATTDRVIDSIYRWLDGQTPVPDFKVDLSAKKVEFADRVAKAVDQRAAGLPRCSTAPTSGSFDPFNTTCLPPGVTAAQAAVAIRSDILNGAGFLDEPVITADSVKSADSNRSVFADQLKQTPDTYRKLKTTPLIFGLITLLSLLAFILLSNSRRRGFKHLGFVLIGIGIFVMFFGLAVNSAVNNKVLPQISLTNGVLQADLRKLVHDAAQRVNNTFLAIGGGYAALGALAVGGFYLMERRRPVLEAAGDGAIAAPTDEAEKPKPKSKPSANKKIKAE
jgi:hypothetical protein